jgi:hypothetical protein
MSPDNAAHEGPIVSKTCSSSPLVTLVATFVAALASSRRPRLAGAVAAVITTIVVGGGLVVVFALYSSWWRKHPAVHEARAGAQLLLMDR